jgi:hypothetical protein
MPAKLSSPADTFCAEDFGSMVAGVAVDEIRTPIIMHVHHHDCFRFESFISTV